MAHDPFQGTVPCGDQALACRRLSEDDYYTVDARVMKALQARLQQHPDLRRDPGAATNALAVTRMRVSLEVATDQPDDATSPWRTLVVDDVAVAWEVYQEWAASFRRRRDRDRPGGADASPGSPLPL